MGLVSVIVKVVFIRLYSPSQTISISKPGKAISGLDPYYEWYIVFELPPKDRALLDAIVQSFLHKGKLGDVISTLSIIQLILSLGQQV